jgi:hypothetical protein
MHCGGCRRQSLPGGTHACFQNRILTFGPKFHFRTRDTKTLHTLGKDRGSGVKGLLAAQIGTYKVPLHDRRTCRVSFGARNRYLVPHLRPPLVVLFSVWPLLMCSGVPDSKPSCLLSTAQRLACEIAVCRKKVDSGMLRLRNTNASRHEPGHRHIRMEGVDEYRSFKSCLMPAVPATEKHHISASGQKWRRMLLLSIVWD